MTLHEIYLQVNSRLETMDLGTLFAGFHLYKFAIYNSSEICIDGGVIPWQSDFRGNTSLKYKNEYVAIWNYELDPVEDMDYLAYCMVHEMFHCYQNENHERRFPSDLALLNYPDDLFNFTRKYNENRCLAAAYTNGSFESFRMFMGIRNQRAKQYPRMVTQEMKAETFEGMAEYVGLKALRLLDRKKFEATVNDYTEKLIGEGSLLFDVRRISYYSGAVFFLCLDLFGYHIAGGFTGELTPYEQIKINTDDIVPIIREYPFIRREYQKLTSEKTDMINRHLECAAYIECKAFICGYDPMNMYRWQKFIYCKYFVALNENGNVFPLNEPVLLVLAANSDSEIIGYYVRTKNE